MAAKIRKVNDFTSGPILKPMIKFTLPILGSMILQSLYGAVDLWVVGKFGITADVSAVATGSQMIGTITNIIIGIAVGTAVLLGQKIGAGEKEAGGDILAAGIKFFFWCAVAFTILVPLLAPQISSTMNAPAEAFAKTVSYIRTCAYGAIFIISYNLLSSIFKGIGDSTTPLIAVSISAVINVGGDIFFVAKMGLGAYGAALATVMSQGISVIICLFVIRKQGLPFSFSLANLKKNQKQNVRKSVKIGAPIALQSLLVNISFLVLTAIINDLGLTQSSGLGVSQKLCAFIMLLPSAFSQSLSSMVAQNIGARKPDRAKKVLITGICCAFCLSAVVAYFAFFHGVALAGIFSNDSAVCLAAADYLKAYAIDCILVPFLFCFIGYFNGCGRTVFTMIQGLVGAFCVRIPVSLVMKAWEPVTLFHIGLATPASSFVQIIMCVIFFVIRNKKDRTE